MCSPLYAGTQELSFIRSRLSGYPSKFTVKSKMPSLGILPKDTWIFMLWLPEILIDTPSPKLIMG